jgi:hypothetical protein
VNKHELIVQIEGDFVAMVFNVFECIQEHIVGVFVVTGFLLLGRDIDSNSYSLFNIANC